MFYPRAQSLFTDFILEDDMARRSKIPPTVRKIVIGGVVAGQPEVFPTGWVDIAQCLSLMNRKAFRQGMEYYIESWSISSSQPCDASLFTLDESWVNTNAWVKAFHTWLKSQEQLDDFDQIKGRYHDFKVFMSRDHQDDGVIANLLPYDFSLAQSAVVSPSVMYEWAESHIQIPNDGAVGTTNEYDLHMLGPDQPASAGSRSKGIVAGYAESRARPQTLDPNTTMNLFSWMDSAFDDGDNLFEIRSDVQSENDTPPYLIDQDTSIEFYPGGTQYLSGAGDGMTVQHALAINPALGSYIIKRGPGFVAPLGLVRIVGTPETIFQITLNIAVGPYKGVMARPMQDVN